MGWIRVFLALSVVLWHMPLAPMKAMNASVAVVCFFVISGFYMATAINERYAKEADSGWIRRFYTSRFLRIYPAYLIMLAVMVIWFWLTKSPNVFTGHTPIPWLERATLVVMNVSLFGQDLFEAANQGILQNSAPAVVWSARQHLGEGFFSEQWMLVGQAWSLASEVTFYLIAPFVVRSPLKTAACFLVSLGIRVLIVGILGYRSGVWGYWFFPGSCCMFFLGSLAYHGHRLLRPDPALAKLAGIGCMSGLACWCAWHLALRDIILPSDATGSIDGVNFWVFYLLFAGCIPFIFQATQHWKIDRMLGDLSYPLYLVHGLMLGLVYNRWAGPKGSVADSIMAVFLSVIAAWALKAVVDVVFEPKRRQLSGSTSRDSTTLALHLSPAE